MRARAVGAGDTQGWGVIQAMAGGGGCAGMLAAVTGKWSCPSWEEPWDRMSLLRGAVSL